MAKNFKTAKLFPTDPSQAVRLPAQFRFKGGEVFISRDPETGDVILSQKLHDWDLLQCRHQRFADVRRCRFAKRALATTTEPGPIRRRRMSYMLDTNTAGLLPID